MLKTQRELHRGKWLRVARMGSGPPVICLHGYPDNLQIWSEIARALAASHEVIAFDWPGMGYSEAWPGGSAPQDMADRLLSLIADWKLDRVSLIGIDMGGQPALVFAAGYPERTLSVVVMNSLVTPEARTSWEIRWLRKLRLNQWLLRHWPRLVFHRALETFLPRGFTLPAEIRADFRKTFRQPEVRNFVSSMCAEYEEKLPLLPELYPQIKAPTLILWAALDRHFPVAHGQELQQRIAQSELQIVSDGRHWMPLHCGQEVVRRIEDFWRRRAA